MTLPDTSKLVHELPPPLRAPLAPFRKVPFGLAAAAVLGPALLLLGLYHALFDADVKWIWLLRNNFGFVGFVPTVPGAFAGLFWGALHGFVIGWLIAVLRNTVLWLIVTWIAAKQRLRVGGHVLDDLM